MLECWAPSSINSCHVKLGGGDIPSSTPGFNMLEQSINSANPKALSGWYTEKLGLDASCEYQGIYYGSFSTKSGDFHLGIHPIPAGAKVGAPNISITFRVSDFRSAVVGQRPN